MPWFFRGLMEGGTSVPFTIQPFTTGNAMPEKPQVALLVQSRFPLGMLSITAGALTELSAQDIETGLNAHASGKWGELDHEDTAANERALENGGRLVSVHQSEVGSRFYVITEADRSHTTILLPSEY
jgi:hypothetical protein